MRYSLLLALFCAAAFAQPSSTVPPASIHKACVGTPGSTTGTYRQQCQDTNGTVYACNNSSGCTTAGQWIAGGASGGAISGTTGAFTGNVTVGTTVLVGTAGSGLFPSIKEITTVGSPENWYRGWTGGSNSPGVGSNYVHVDMYNGNGTAVITAGLPALGRAIELNYCLTDAASCAEEDHVVQFINGAFSARTLDFAHNKTTNVIGGQIQADSLAFKAGSSETVLMNWSATANVMSLRGTQFQQATNDAAWLCQSNAAGNANICMMRINPSNQLRIEPPVVFIDKIKSNLILSSPNSGDGISIQNADSVIGLNSTSNSQTMGSLRWFHANGSLQWFIGGNQYNTDDLEFADSGRDLGIIKKTTGTWGFGPANTSPTGTVEIYNATASTGVTREWLREGAGQSTGEAWGIYANDGTTKRIDLTNNIFNVTSTLNIVGSSFSFNGKTCTVVAGAIACS